MDAPLTHTARLGQSLVTGSSPCKPHLFLLLESRRPLALSQRFDLGGVHLVRFGRGNARSFECVDRPGEKQLLLRIPDPWMSSRHAVIERRGARFLFTDQGSTNGSVINGTPTTSAELADGDVIELGQTFFLFRAALPTSDLEPEILEAADLDRPTGMTSLVPALSKQFDDLAQIVKSETPVIIMGASGSGKEVIARAAHTLSQRPGRFVAVNCGSLPRVSVETELFGHKRGAFAGAEQDREGLIMAANGGTLFLDEVSDLPLASQAALLRVLQEREVVPVGATTPVPVDFRLVCSTHRDVERLVARGSFREDLYARIFGFMLQLPTLRERVEDLGLLIGTLLEELAPQLERPSLSAEAARALLAYHWPRNIRELRTSLQAALALAGGPHIELAHLVEPVRRAVAGPIALGARVAPTSAETSLNDEQAERRQRIIELLQLHRGNISAVARSMGKVRSQVQRWIKRYGLDPESYRD